MMWYVLGGLVLTIVLSVAGGFSLTKHEYTDRTEFLKSASALPKQALVVYQPSVTPASYDVAYAIAKGLCDAGYDVKLSNPGKHLTSDISAYSVVVFGSPNYGGSVCEPLTNYVQSITDFSGKKILLFSTSGAVEIMPELDKLATLLHGVKPFSMTKFQCNDTDKNKDTAYQLGVDLASS